MMPPPLKNSVTGVNRKHSYLARCSLCLQMLFGNKGLSFWVEEMPEDRFTTLPSGGFSTLEPKSLTIKAETEPVLSPIQIGYPTILPTVEQPSNNLPGLAGLTAGPSSLGGEGSYSGTCLQGEVRPSDRRCRHKSQSGEVALAATPQSLPQFNYQIWVLTIFRVSLAFAQPNFILFAHLLVEGPSG